MPPKPKFCPQCAAPVETKDLHGKPGNICSACAAVVYQNPPPLAASVVLNERREVLLVKCRRWRDTPTWCLPMGFVEAGEGVAQAALRALKETTGVDGRTVRLLDTDTSPSDEGGDLLIVTFEMKKTGGSERPGPQAETVAYFPLSRFPDLAFAANEKALRACADTHMEEWAIRDSYEHLHHRDEKVMLSDALVPLIKERAGEVAQAWYADVRENPSTKSYATLDRETLLEKATSVLTQFRRWLSGEAKQEISDFYFQIGRERKAQGLSVREVLSALMLLKKHLWEFTRDHGVRERPIDVYRTLELSRRIAVFFDKAIYHTTRGFEAEEKTD